MKPNDEAIKALADVLQHHGVFHGWFPKGLPSDWRQLDPIGRREFLDIAGRLADAAYAAQFKSEDYAGLIERLLDFTEICEGKNNDARAAAADALEAVLAERDAWKRQAEICRDRLQETEITLGKFVQERDSLKADNESMKQSLPLWAHKQMAANNELIDCLRAERDALAARLAPVDDKAMVEIGAHFEAKFDGWPFNVLERLTQDLYRLRARDFLSAIRPHIEAAERERCEKVAENQYERMKNKGYVSIDWMKGYLSAARDIRSAIRSGK